MPSQNSSARAGETRRAESLPEQGKTCRSRAQRGFTDRDHIRARRTPLAGHSARGIGKMPRVLVWALRHTVR
jgi:hypothetical protein